MEVGLLGPVTIPVADGQVVPGKRARALLAVLALAGPDPLPTDELASRLWAGTRPPDPASALETLLGQLAAALPDGAVLRTDTGRALDRRLVTTDADRFAGLVAEAASARAAGEATRARDRLTQALAVWRGPALAEVRVTPYLEAEATRLDESRLATVEDRCDLVLQDGSPADLVDHVRRLVDEHPTRERLWGLLMTALHRSGRADDAIGVYAEARERLADELGIAPGEALQQLEAGIVR